MNAGFGKPSMGSRATKSLLFFGYNSVLTMTRGSVHGAARVEVVDEVAEASRGVNSYGTNVDHRLGHEFEKH